MKHEKSCGIIPFIINNEDIAVLIIKQNNGVVGFSKGHVENNESEEETALRECLEETGLHAEIVKDSRQEISYYMSEYKTHKTVAYFTGIIKDINFHKQDSEISDIQIVSVDDALRLLTFDDTKELLVKAVKYLSK